MRSFVPKPRVNQRTSFVHSAMSSSAHLSHRHDVNPPASQQDRKLEAIGTPAAPSRFGIDFGQIAIYPPELPALQAKLMVGEPGDEYEQEADRTAERVMRVAEPQLQRACACGGACPNCRTDRLGHGHERLQPQRVQASNAGQVAAPPIVHEALASPGQPLDNATRAFMEPRLGHDFSRVRVHADSHAGKSAQAVDAVAYTVGSDIVFGAGQYDPSSSSGRRLLAHELVHVMQQQGLDSGPLRRIAVSPLRQHLSGDGAQCGDDHFIEYDFELDKPAPCDGYIVQQVDIFQDIQNCANCPAAAPGAPAVTYWEGWWVAKGGTVQELRTRRGAFSRFLKRPQHDWQGTTYTDRPHIEHSVGTCGTSDVVGTIKFFCKESIAAQALGALGAGVAGSLGAGAAQAGRSLGASVGSAIQPGTGDLGKEDEPPAQPGSPWGPNKVFGGTTPGWLPATNQKPPFWDLPPIEGPAARVTTNKWHCCPGTPDLSQSNAIPKV
jgi:hypothetical protein